MRVALVAGEASGDMLGGMLLAAMRARWPGLRAFGIGGEHMRAQGFDAWWPYDKLAVNGYADALAHLPELFVIRETLKKRLVRDPPDAFIGIDAPDFNLGLEARLKAKGIRTLHFVSPSIWAWRAGRIPKIGRSVDRMLCVFPFEKAIYDNAGIPASYVGHPLASRIPLPSNPQAERDAARGQLGMSTTLAAGQPLLAVLPGSRQSEIKRIAPRFFGAMQLLVRAMPALQFVMPAVPTHFDVLQQGVQAAGLKEKVCLLQGQSHLALAACDVALVASGTATLEAMLYRRPMVVSYVASAVSAAIFRRIRLIPWAGLPNILARETLVPELLQENATPQALADAVLHWFTHPEDARKVQARFAELHEELRRDTGELCCRAIGEVIESHRSAAPALT